VANYRYQEKLFQILINGRTGKVSGERPWSFWKIFGLVAVILLAIGLIVALIAGLQGTSGQPAPRRVGQVDPSFHEQPRGEPVIPVGLCGDRSPIMVRAGPGAKIHPLDA
jgi:hypothetical protein